MADTTDATAQINLVAIAIGRYWDAVLIEDCGGKRHRFRMANSTADFTEIKQGLSQSFNRPTLATGEHKQDPSQIGP